MSVNERKVSAAQLRHNLIAKKREAAKEAEERPPKRVKTGVWDMLLKACSDSAKATAGTIMTEYLPGKKVFKIDVNATFGSFGPEVKQAFEKLDFTELADLLEPHVADWPVTAPSGGAYTKQEIAAYMLGGELKTFVKNRPEYPHRDYDTKMFKCRQAKAFGLRQKADGIGLQVKEVVLELMQKHSNERRFDMLEGSSSKIENTMQNLRLVLTPEQRAQFDELERGQHAEQGNPQAGQEK
jgi:hypothetical protein